MSFHEIIGNERIINNLQMSILNNKVSHAYIFDGQKGMGKKLLAKEFAKTLQCEKHGEDSCGVCISCTAFDSGNHPDIFYVKASKTKAIGIDDIREQVTKPMELKPYLYKYKIFIIADADTMTVQAQNALLKTIEEPAAYGIFILLSTNFNLFLETVLSRCVMFKLKPLSKLEIDRYLVERTKLSEDIAFIYSSYAQGSIGKALELSTGEDFIHMREKIVTILINIRTMDLGDFFVLPKEFESYKEHIQEVLDIIYLWYRDLIVSKCMEKSAEPSSSDAFIIEKDKLSLIKKESGHYSLKKLYDSIHAVWQTKLNLKQNGNFLMSIEVMLYKLKEN